MEQIVEQAYLYDFYGELLNEHQRRIYEDFVFQDLSLAEIAEAEGISRQGVHDMIRRCTKSLESYEAKLHLVKKFMDTRERVARIQKLVDGFHNSRDDSILILEEIKQISNAILEEL